MEDELEWLLPPVPGGWWPIMRRLYAQLGADFPGARIRYAKEKFGVLRVSVEPYGPYNPKLSALVNDAVKESQTTCQKCGTYGRERIIHRCVMTLCDAHFMAMTERWPEDP